MRWIFLAFALASAGEVLVLLDSNTYKETHSKFFESISSRGHKLTIKRVDSQGLRLEKYDEYLYSAIILICPSTDGNPYTDLTGKISVPELLKFSDNGGSLLVFADTDVASQYRKLANEFGIDYHDQGTRLFGETRVIKSNNFTAPGAIFTSGKEKVSFSGIGINFNKDSRFLIPVLASGAKDIVRNEFKTSEKTGASHAVIGFQGRNNARAVFTGSIDICANNYTNDEKIANLKFCVEVSKWVLNEKGILRYSKITHFRENDPKPKGNLEAEYTINDDLVYSIDLEELKGGNWAQFKTNKAYVEFVMLEPKIRKYLQFNSGSLTAKFRAPDVHGVYQFKTFLYEPGYTWIETASKATVRPFKHNQFERFLMCATPYYCSVFASISGFVIFSFSFLYHKST